MNAKDAKIGRLELVLGDLLHYGTWLASALIGLGLALALIARGAGVNDPGIASSLRVVMAGIALFILLPVLRVILMLAAFVRIRDFRFAVIAALVLVIVLMGFVLGMYW